MSVPNNVLELSLKLQKLQNRLAELDAERSSVETEIAVCMSELGKATSAHVLPGTNASSRDLALWVIRKYPERPISPNDVAREGGIEPTTVRSLLQRMARQGIIRRTSHGRYELVKR
jgi:hypothetical protein